MIATIIILALAFIWLGIETRWLTIRLPVGSKPVDKTLPVVIVETKVKPSPTLLLPEVCELTRVQRELASTKYKKDSWRYGTSYNNNRPDSYQTTIIGNHKVTLVATLYNLYDLIADVNKAQTDKPRKPNFKPCQLPMDAFIETVRVGSHQEWVETDDKGHGYHNTITDYTTHYNDCLPGKVWLKEHEHDLDKFEPTMELSIDGKSLSLNGNYKKGAIQSFMGEYTEKVRAGKKTLTIQKGGHVENCGGGVYIAVNERCNKRFCKSE